MQTQGYPRIHVTVLIRVCVWNSVVFMSTLEEFYWVIVVTWRSDVCGGGVGVAMRHSLVVARCCSSGRGVVAVSLAVGSDPIATS